MDISVILCTYNRCDRLANALESVARSKLPEAVEWEVLVVDNNSSDQTREIATQFCSVHPDRFRYLFEPQSGKSHALNAGIRDARGKTLAFMDDDVTVDPDWLRNLTAPLTDNEWAGVGGRILPPPDFMPPNWLSLHGEHGLGGVLALFDRGDVPHELTAEWAPYGTNMCFRSEMFSRHGGFRLDLGPNPKNEIRGEDIEYGRRLISAGERLRYQPSAVVYHPVPENRLKKEYFLSFWFDLGRMSIRHRKRRPSVLFIPRKCFTFIKTLVVLSPFRVLRWISVVDPARRFYFKCWVWKTAGELDEMLRWSTRNETRAVNAG
jgi:glucosyl-dolichyl phosphate glucuronosyltransferase